MCSRQYNRKYKASIFSILQVQESEKLTGFTLWGAQYALFLLASIVLSYAVLCNAISFIIISSSTASFPSFLPAFLPFQNSFFSTSSSLLSIGSGHIPVVCDMSWDFLAFQDLLLWGQFRPKISCYQLGSQVSGSSPEFQIPMRHKPSSLCVPGLAASTSKWMGWVLPTWERKEKVRRRRWKGLWT